MTVRWRRWTAVAVLVGTGAATAPGVSAESSLTAVDMLARAYGRLLDADFTAAERALSACEGAPPEACQVLKTTALWWRIQLDPPSTALDAAFTESVTKSIDATEQWTRREPTRAEAWFYLGGAYACRVQWRVLRNERLAAARDGKRIKDALERAVALDPTLDDAYFGIGMYQYYAAIAPTAAKILRWLLWLPGGNREQGLAQMVRVRTHGVLLRGEADYQMALLYLWYEHQHQQALELLKGLRSAYPHNPLFYKEIAQVQDVYFHDPAASLEAYRSLLAAVEQGRVNATEIAAFEARFGMATQFEALFETDRAIEQLNTIIEREGPSTPYASRARALLALGEAQDRLGHRDLALAAYRAAIAYAPADDPFRVRPRATQAIRRRPDAMTAEAYRLSLEGWRHVEQRSLRQADGALRRSLELRPADPVTRYRYGRLLVLQRQEPLALVEFERVVASRPIAPPVVLAAAYLDAGRLLEGAGERPRAMQMYKNAAGVVGGSSDTRAAAIRALARLSSASPPSRSVRR